MNTNSDQNEHKANFEENIKYYFDPQGPHTPLVEVDPNEPSSTSAMGRLSTKQSLHNPFSTEESEMSQSSLLNPNYLHKKWREQRYLTDEKQQKVNYYLDKLKNLGYNPQEGRAPMMNRASTLNSEYGRYGLAGC